MKKTFLFSAALLMSGTMMAGGYLTNTNQSINFLRNPARDASIGIDGVYYNPAGVAMLDDGWHMQFNWQWAHQHRDTWSDYQLPGLGYDHLFKYNTENPATEETNFTHKFKGRVNVPIQPSLFLAYNKNDWSFQFGTGFIGGGGGCEFENGVGQFEYLAAASGISALSAKGMKMTGYSLDTYLDGSSYDLGFTLTAAHHFKNGLNLSLGLRGIYAMWFYEGYLKNINYQGEISVGDVKQTITVPSGTDLILDCKQTGFSVAPIIGIDYRLNKHFNFAAKYEFKTSINLKTDADNNAAFDALAAGNAAFSGYVDGAETRSDLPALLTVGVQYSPIDQLRINAGYHHYFDTDTKQWFESSIGNTNEFLVGAEYDINDALQVSAGYQRSIFDQESDFHTETSFNLDAYSIGFGLGYQLSKTVKLNAAYFRTIYSNHNQTQPLTTEIGGNEVQIGQKEVTYSRINQVIGLGVEVDF